MQSLIPYTISVKHYKNNYAQSRTVVNKSSICWMLAENVILSVMQDLKANHTVVNIATFYNIIDRDKNIFMWYTQ